MFLFSHRKLAIVTSIASVSVLAFPPAAHAATTTTRTCTDGGGVTWRSVVTWNGRYDSPSYGDRRVAVDGLKWTATNVSGVVATDFDVTVKDGQGVIEWSSASLVSRDYASGGSYYSTNPKNPIATSGPAQVRLGVGKDGDGKPRCYVTHTEPNAPTGTVYTVAAAGDIATSGSSSSGAAATARTVTSLNTTAVLTLGDNAYPDGTAADFSTKYGPTWGAFRNKTWPSPGNHEYRTSGASGYFGYFSGRVNGKAYYAVNIGRWRVYSLNSEIPTGAGSAQATWLRNDLSANVAGKHVLAYWHKPRFACGEHPANTVMSGVWATLDAAGADVVLAGHNHSYERFAPMTSSGSRSSSGMRSFVVGTGGAPLHAVASACPNREKAYAGGYGVLKLTLDPASYSWKFVGTDGVVRDSGTVSVG